MRSGFLDYDEDFRLPVRARYQRVRRGVDAEQVRALRHRHGSGTLSGPLVRTCIATADHLGEIVRLLAIQLREHRIDLDSGRLEAAVRGVLEDPARGFFMVMEAGGRTVGAAYVSFIWALEHGGHSAWLEEIFIDPACRESGLGTRFLQAVMTECAARGCAALDLEIDADHERVRSLYRRHGFEELPRRRLVRRLAGPDGA